MQPLGLAIKHFLVGLALRSPDLLHFLSVLSCLTVVFGPTPEKINPREGLVASKVSELLFLTNYEVPVCGLLAPFLLAWGEGRHHGREHLAEQSSSLQGNKAQKVVKQLETGYALQRT